MSLRNLAKSNKYQLLYNKAKDFSSLKLFYNDIKLSGIQIYFLYYLEMYKILYDDLALGKKFISEDVIKDSIRTDAYLLWKQEENK